MTIVTPDVKEKMQSLIDAGYGVAEIALRLNINRNTLQYHFSKMRPRTEKKEAPAKTEKKEKDIFVTPIIGYAEGVPIRITHNMLSKVLEVVHCINGCTIIFKNGDKRTYGTIE
jgi:orotate phosphoribosyltransferase-like protein